MNNRERCMNILHFKPADRLPAVHFGYWKDLLLEWAEQGKISKDLAMAQCDNNEADHELEKLIGWDFEWAPMGPVNNFLSPAFEWTVLETLPDGTQRIMDNHGLIQRYHPGATSIPEEDDYLLKDRTAFETLYRPKMQFSENRVNYALLKDFNEKVYEPSDRPVGLSIGSVLGDIRSMASLVGMSYLMYDEDEDLLADIVDAYAEMQYQCTEAVLKTGAKFDFAHFWEDICFNSGPLLSPAKFRELCAKHYKKRTDLCRKYGIDVVSLDCDGVTGQLLDVWMENGVNTMFPIEIGTWGDQFGPAREKYGKSVLGVGGMNKLVLRQDKDAVDRELERLKPLIALGGFVPCPDHRLMPGTKFELVQYYAEKIKEIKL